MASPQSRALPALAAHERKVEAAHVEAETVRIGRVSVMLRRGAGLIAETIVVPAVLLYVAMALSGPTAGLVAVLVWRLVMMAGRVPLGIRVPASVVLSTGIFGTRAGAGLIADSVAVYLWQPVVTSLVLGVVFAASATRPRPMTTRLVCDVVALPTVLQADPRVRRFFAEIAVAWGLIQLVGAWLGAWTLLTYPVEMVVLIHGGLGMVTLALTAVATVGWGWWRLRRMPDVRVRFGNQEACHTSPDLDRLDAAR